MAKYEAVSCKIRRYWIHAFFYGEASVWWINVLNAEDNACKLYIYSGSECLLIARESNKFQETFVGKTYKALNKFYFTLMFQIIYPITLSLVDCLGLFLFIRDIQITDMEATMGTYDLCSYGAE